MREPELNGWLEVYKRVSDNVHFQSLSLRSLRFSRGAEQPQGKVFKGKVLDVSQLESASQWLSLDRLTRNNPGIDEDEVNVREQAGLAVFMALSGCQNMKELRCINLLQKAREKLILHLLYAILYFLGFANGIG
ncbi:hypothetical protein DUI87_21032 [Hirundo rustica rustica]|uniref:Uncharacterized protein n=1 Tax=Hirundo rustica rustica TaxID=333673 RepID=A0A3M0JNM2_HIRRU|nr:hypothetical protein DUI87_21032 [Hirundo rustica rustica]